MPSTVHFDRAATALSAACIVHCIALPIAAIALPFLAAVSEAEWVHWLLTALAIAASGTVIATAHDARRPAFLAPALIGIGMITAALFAENFGVEETIPTVIGGTLLAAAHAYRLLRHS